jgi:REDY-like protein HapK
LVTLISSYALRPEADRDEFLEWARSVDLPTCRARPGVRRFDMYIVARDDGEPKYSIIEVFELEAEDTLELSDSTTSKDWERFADPTSVRNVFCNPIDEDEGEE